VASCTGKAFGLIERHTGDPFKAWGVLQEKFCATDVEANYPEIEKEFQNSKLEGTARDPELWFNDLDHFNVRLGRISRDLVKSELQLKSHMMANMSSAYDPVVMKFRGELVETSIEKFQKEILMHYKFLLSTGKAGNRVQTDHAMMVMMASHPWKKFKGTCRKCGKIGHKSEDCRGKRGGGGVEMEKDKSNITCYNCQQKGHYANKCPNPKVDRQNGGGAGRLPAPIAMNMFVGCVSTSDQETNQNDLEDWGLDEDSIEDDVKYNLDKTETIVDFMSASQQTFFRKTKADVSCTNKVKFKQENVEENFIGPSYDTTMGSYNETVMNTTMAKGTSDTFAFLRNPFAFLSTTNHVPDTARVTKKPDKWLLDSGATCHVTHNAAHMTNVGKAIRNITVGNGEQVSTLSQGDIFIKDNASDTAPGYVGLHDVFYTPTFTKNIISLRQLFDDDWKIDSADIQKITMSNGLHFLVFVTCPADNLYYLDGERALMHKEEKVLSHELAPIYTYSVDVNTAHSLLGHPDTRTVRNMARFLKWKLTGDLLPCGSCALAKAKAKSVPKSTQTRATKPGERLFLDISGPFNETLKKNKFWLRIVDDHTRYCWNLFLQRKNGYNDQLDALLYKNAKMGKPCRYLRCDNAGENVTLVKALCVKYNITLEMTAPHTPQTNGVVERSFVTCRDRAFATLLNARFSPNTQKFLWAEAVHTTTQLGNVLIAKNEKESPFTKFFGDDKPHSFVKHLQPFGRIGMVSMRNKLKPKWKPKATKMLFTGYAEDHSGDTYRFFNPQTLQVIYSRDVVWMEWHGRVTATDDLSLFEEIENLRQTTHLVSPDDVETDDGGHTTESISEDTKELSIVRNHPMVPLEEVAIGNTGAVEDPPGRDDNPAPAFGPPARRRLYIPNPEARMTRAQARMLEQEDLDGIRRDPETDAEDESVPQDDVVPSDAEDEATSQNETLEDIDNEQEIVEGGEYCISADLMSDPQPNVPKDYKALMKMNDPSWLKSLNAELENFLSRGAWKFLPRSQLPNGRKTLRCRWIFKQKTDAAKTKKSRSVVKGYEQVPGVDFVESYSPLATNTTIRVVLAVALENAQVYEDWFTCLVDVEAAFLNAKVDSDVYIEMPEGLQEYLKTKGQNIGDSVIKLERAQYGLVQSPRLWMETFSVILKNLGMIQCKTDPCLFSLHDSKDRLLVLVVVYSDDSIITGRTLHVDDVKSGIQKAVNIADLGTLTRHLGVNYEFGFDEHGNYLASSMVDYVKAVVTDFEELTGGPVRSFLTPGVATTPPLKSVDPEEVIEIEKYRSFVGRVLFSVSKTDPYSANAVRELTTYLSAPNAEHWKALTHFIGYLKQGMYPVLKMRPPKERRVVAFVDSDYASDRNDRKSVSGYIVTIGGCIVAWQSKKQTGITLSTTEAEFVAMSTVATEMKFVVSLLTEIYKKAPLMPSLLKEDNTGAIFMAKNTAIGQRTKHVDIRARFVNDMVTVEKTLIVDHIPSGENPSDGMTKNLPDKLHAHHAARIYNGLLNDYEFPVEEDVKPTVALAYRRTVYCPVECTGHTVQ
jgi:hypothetical protein